jgi:hypothetical protein
MSPVASQSIGARRRAYQRQIERLIELTDQLAAFPEADPFEDGQVVRFRLRMGGNEYDYAAIRAAGMWYTTARTDNIRRSWLALVSWMVDGHEVVSFESMVAADSITNPQRSVLDEVQVFPAERACPNRVECVDHDAHRWGLSGDTTVYFCTGWTTVEPGAQ